jgi:hypothetical protein
MRHGRLALAAGGAAALAAVAAGAALALGGGSGTSNFGPYTRSGLVDVSTCGRLWAEGTDSLTYRVFPQASDGTYTVQGIATASLRTIPGSSLGACNNSSADNGAAVAGGIPVHATDEGVIVVTNGTLDRNATCATFCLTPAFVRTVFGPAATFRTVSDLEDYRSGCNGSWLASFTASEGVEAGDISGLRAHC